MKDLFTISIAGILLWWVAVYFDTAWGDVIFDDNKIWVVTKVFSF
jgi:hypothetical protein